MLHDQQSGDTGSFLPKLDLLSRDRANVSGRRCFQQSSLQVLADGEGPWVTWLVHESL